MQQLAALERRLRTVEKPHANRTCLIEGGLVSNGLEERTARDRYDWHGDQRGNEAFVVLQYTLAGWGSYTDATGVTTRVDPGMLLTAWIPSPHRYFLPVASPLWRFCYVLVQHRWFHERLGLSLRQGAAVLASQPDQPVASALVRLWMGLHDPQMEPLRTEQMVCDLLIAHARQCRQMSEGGNRGEQLLREVRDTLAADPTRHLDIEDLALLHGLSRSAYTHCFTTATGLSPARYLLDQRLDLVRQALLSTAQTLEQIAVQTGFADANHLCKAFRRRYQISPGRFRRNLTG